MIEGLVRRKSWCRVPAASMLLPLRFSDWFRSSRASFQSFCSARSCQALLAGAVLVATPACRPQIGDSCESSVNCSATGERLCDVTQPGGYCTVFNCEPGTCPDGSVCVAFGASLSQYESCQDVDGLSRFERTYCVRTCDEGDDCRGGYACEDLNVVGAARNAVPVDASKSAKVCLVATDPNAEKPEHSTDVCQ